MYTYTPASWISHPTPSRSSRLGHHRAPSWASCAMYAAGSRELSIQVCLFNSMKAKQALISKKRLIQLWFLHIGYEYLMSQRNIY